MKDRIKKLRKNYLDLTQREFAERLGIKGTTIANYESGRNEPVDSVISLICREFNVNEEWLRYGTGEMFVQQTMDEQITEFIGTLQTSADDSFKKRFIAAMAALDESEWKLVEKFVNAMQENKQKKD